MPAHDHTQEDGYDSDSGGILGQLTQAALRKEVVASLRAMYAQNDRRVVGGRVLRS